VASSQAATSCACSPPPPLRRSIPTVKTSTFPFAALRTRLVRVLRRTFSASLSRASRSSGLESTPPCQREGKRPLTKPRRRRRGERQLQRNPGASKASSFSLRR
jgi:hypothetical protein